MKKTTILILAANPKDTNRVRLDEEVREIDEGLRRSKYSDLFVLQQKWAVRSGDIHRAMLDYDPQIVHFSGHGSGSKGICVEDETGQMSLISVDALSELFELFSGVDCVILNACYSEIQAEAIVRHVKYVVGMNEEISDKAAIKFVVAFYDAIGAGKSFEFAFKLGCNTLHRDGVSEYLKPVLKIKPTHEAFVPKKNIGTGTDNIASDAPEEEPGNIIQIRDLVLQVHRNCQEKRVSDGVNLLLDAGRRKKEVDEVFSFLLHHWRKSARFAKLLLDFIVATTCVANSVWTPFERIEQLKTAIQAAEHLGQNEVQSGLKINLANTYWLEAQIQPAQDLYNELLQRHRAEHLSLSNDELCAIYIGLGCCCAAEENLDKSIQYFEQAKYIAETKKLPVQLGYALCSIGDISLRQGNLGVAFDNYQRALKIAEQQEDISLQVRVFRGCGNVYTRWGAVASAQEHYNQGLNIVDSLTDKFSSAVITIDKNLSPMIAENQVQNEEVRSKLLEVLHKLEPVISKIRQST